MTKHRSPDERAAQILDAAKSCFLQKGYFATKMDEIAREAGLSKGGVYFHFDSKRQIFRELVQQEYEHNMAFIDEVDAGSGDMVDKLMSLGVHFVQLFAEQSEQPRFMAIIGEMALRDEQIRQMLLELQDSYIVRITALIEEGIEAGQFRANIDARAVAFVLKSLIDGAQASFALGYRVDMEGLLATATSLIMRGLASEEGELAQAFDEFEGSSTSA